MSVLQVPVETNRIKKPPGRDYLSYSAVSLYASCPLRYYFRYIQNLPERLVSASLVFGSSMHAAVEFHFRELLAGNRPPALDVLLGVFWDSWNGYKAETIQYPKSEDLDSMGRLADRMCKAFQTSSFASPGGTIIGVEEELRGELVPGLPDLLGRVDLLLDTDADLLVTDFKTSRSEWGIDHVDDSADQLLLYHELVKPLADGRPVRLAFAVLTKTKFPELTLYPVPVDQRQITRTKRIVERVYRSIQSGNFYPSPSPLKCPSCPYRVQCRAWTG